MGQSAGPVHPRRRAVFGLPPSLEDGLPFAYSSGAAYFGLQKEERSTASPLRQR
jgi:hypothetical protein